MEYFISFMYKKIYIPKMTRQLTFNSQAWLTVILLMTILKLTTVAYSEYFLFLQAVLSM